MAGKTRVTAAVSNGQSFIIGLEQLKTTAVTRLHLVRFQVFIVGNNQVAGRTRISRTMKDMQTLTGVYTQTQAGIVPRCHPSADK